MALKRIALLTIGVFAASAAMTSAQMKESSSGMSADPPKLNDAELAHIALTADNIDIAYAHLALAFSENVEVRRFAETMIADHSAVNAKAAALAKKLGLVPEDNDVSRGLAAQARVKMDELSQKRGAEFDRAYAANELVYHEAVNAAVRDLLIPGIRNAELKKLVQSAVPVFNAHEDHVRRLNGTFRAGM